MWHKYLPLAAFAYNTFNAPNLANHSPYESVFGRKPKLLLDLETDPDIKISVALKRILHTTRQETSISAQTIARC